MKIIVTGAAGFIGFHLSKTLLNSGVNIVGIDNINDYYDPNLKLSRLAILQNFDNFEFHKQDLSNSEEINEIFKKHDDAEIVIHLAAQAGVRYSLQNPSAYIQSNLIGHFNVMEACRKLKNLNKLIYASSSSVYGNSQKTPFSVIDKTDSPVSLYAATKKSCELLTESYIATKFLPASIGLRFFTVYGEYGRPDMAYFSFTQDIISGKTIKLFNHGDMLRDFTYVSDIVEGIQACVKLKLEQGVHKIYNLGNNDPVKLEYFVSVLEDLLGKKALIEKFPMQKDDVYKTFADISESKKDLNFTPKTTIEQGLACFIKWFKEYY